MKQRSENAGGCPEDGCDGVVPRSSEATCRGNAIPAQVGEGAITFAESPSVSLMRLVNGYQISQAIHVAATLGLAEHIGDEPRSSEELALATGTHASTLYRLLRALAAIGVFHEGSEKRFTSTAMSACLRYGGDDPVGPWATLIGRPYLRRAWDALLHSVKSGESAFTHVHGENVWAYRAGHPEESTIFDDAMTGITRRVGDAVIEAYDFSHCTYVVDVGGGEGALLARILVAYPALHGILFELTHVADRAEEHLQTLGLGERCRVMSGDFFEGLPMGGDLYILKGILHDWDDGAAIQILRNCRNAIAIGGRLLIVERLIAPPNEGADAKFSDLNMLVTPGGQERTREEFANLLHVANFRLARIIAAGTRVSILECEPSTKPVHESGST